MTKKVSMEEGDLAVHAKMFRRQAGKTRAQAARDMKVSQTSIFNAEESPDWPLIKLRRRMIEAYSQFKVTGPKILLRGKVIRSRFFLPHGLGDDAVGDIFLLHAFLRGAFGGGPPYFIAT